MFLLKYLHLDRFLLLLLAAVLVAAFFPAQGSGKIAVDIITTGAIALLFFLHGAKLSRQALLSGITHWRLHGLILMSTFVLFPILGYLLRFLPESLLPEKLYYGFLFLCILPATVQSAIAFTSIAGGNVAAAVCSASASSLLGIFISPFLATLLIRSGGQLPIWQAVGSIVLQLLLPFILGHLARPFLLHLLNQYPRLVKTCDQSSIVLVVYSAFSAATSNGIWQQVGVMQWIQMIGLSIALLFLVLLFNHQTAKMLHLDRADEITLIFSGSKKSLATGLPMANILFPAASVGIMVLPLMIFHQIQLMVCAVLARRYAQKNPQSK